MKPTKKFAWFLLFFLPVLFQACSEEEDPTPEELLIGTWTFSNQEVAVFADGTEVPKAFYEQYLDEEELQLFPDGTIAEFKSDKTYTISAPGQGEGSGTWSLSSDAKSLTIDANTADALVFNVESLTKNNIVLIYSEEEEDVDLGNGSTADIRIDLTVTFVK